MLWGKCNFLPHIWKLLERKKYAQRLFRKERESWLNFLSLSLSQTNISSHIKDFSAFHHQQNWQRTLLWQKKLWKEYLGLVKRTLQPSHQKKLPFIWKMNGNQDGKFDLFSSTKRQEEWRCPKYNIGKRKRVLGGGAGTMKTGKQIRGKSQNLLCM